MIFDILYNINKESLLSSTAVIIFITVIYKKYNKTINNNLLNLTLSGVDMLFNFQENIKRIAKKSVLNNFTKILKKKSHCLIFRKDNSIITQYIDNNTDLNNINNHDLIIYANCNEDNTEYINLTRFSNKNIIKQNNISDYKTNFLLSGTIIYNDKPYDINNINNLCFKNTCIFDLIYVKWYMKYFYNININGDYKITLIDNEINMKTITSNDYISINSDNYEIINDCTDKKISINIDDIKKNQETIVYSNLSQSDIDDMEDNYNNLSDKSTTTDSSYEMVENN